MKFHLNTRRYDEEARLWTELSVRSGWRCAEARCGGTMPRHHHCFSVDDFLAPVCWLPSRPMHKDAGRFYSCLERILSKRHEPPSANSDKDASTRRLEPRTEPHANRVVLLTGAPNCVTAENGEIRIRSFQARADTNRPFQIRVVVAFPQSSPCPAGNPWRASWPMDEVSLSFS